MRILDSEIPEKKNVHIALTYIYGVGLSTAVKICDALNVDKKLRFKELSDETIAKIVNYIQENNIIVGGELRKQQEAYRATLKRISCYRGTRLSKGLPRSSRTKTNAKTARKLRTLHS